MPHVITETAVFTPTVTVPGGFDSRVDAAEVVEAIAQALANRTRFIKAITDHVARVDTVNTFALLQTFTTGIKSNGAVDCDSTVHADGAIDTDATLHADGTVSSDGLIHAGGNLQADVNILGGGNLTLVGGISAGDDVTIPGSKRVLYTSGLAAWRTTVIPLTDGQSDDVSVFDPLNHWWTNVTGPSFVRFPIHLPSAALLINVTVVEQQVVTPNVLGIVEYVIDFSTTPNPTPMVQNTIAGPTSGATNADPVVTAVTPGASHNINNASTEYAVTVTLQTGNRLMGIQLLWQDPGPRNE